MAQKEQCSREDDVYAYEWRRRHSMFMKLELNETLTKYWIGWCSWYLFYKASVRLLFIHVKCSLHKCFHSKQREKEEKNQQQQQHILSCLTKYEKLEVCNIQLNFCAHLQFWYLVKIIYTQVASHSLQR